MWPFSRKSGAPPPTSDPDDWTIGEGQRDGFPMIVRIDNQFKRIAPLPGFNHHFIISVHFRNPSPNGFPSIEEGDDLETLEEKLCEQLEADKESLCVLVVTNNGLRDFIFYTRNAESAHQRFLASSVGGTGFVIEIAIEPDADWYIYKHFSRSLHTH